MWNWNRSCTKAVIDKDGTYFDLAVKNLTGDEHLSKISLSGAGLKNGYYSIKVNGEEKEQCYVSDNQGDAYAVIPAGESAKITIEAMKVEKIRHQRSIRSKRQKIHRHWYLPV